MKIPKLHSWDLDYASAADLQTQLEKKLRLESSENKISLVAGCDVSSQFHGKDFSAAVVMMTIPGFEVIEIVSATVTVNFPYIPGLLSFREMPALLKAWEKVENVPDLVFCDGSGTIHPRRFGLACHLGLWLNIPTIGCAKNLLCGEHEELGMGKGSCKEVILDGLEIGSAVRTRTGVKPMFVSPGNLISHSQAVELTLKACPRYRIPEPIRTAHNTANEARRAFNNK